MRPPVDHFRVSQGFGGPTYHNGVDLACPHGTPVVAPERMLVTAAGALVRYHDNGVCVIGFAVSSHYVSGPVPPTNREHAMLHMDRVVVHPGQVVEEGELLGYSDNTGHSEGEHVHWSVIRDGTYRDPQAEPDYKVVA